MSSGKNFKTHGAQFSNSQRTSFSRARNTIGQHQHYAPKEKELLADVPAMLANATPAEKKPSKTTDKMAPFGFYVIYSNEPVSVIYNDIKEHIAKNFPKRHDEQGNPILPIFGYPLAVKWTIFNKKTGRKELRDTSFTHFLVNPALAEYIENTSDFPYKVTDGKSSMSRYCFHQVHDIDDHPARCKNTIVVKIPKVPASHQQRGPVQKRLMSTNAMLNVLEQFVKLLVATEVIREDQVSIELKTNRDTGLPSAAARLQFTEDVDVDTFRGIRAFMNGYYFNNRPIHNDRHGTTPSLRFKAFFFDPEHAKKKAAAQADRDGFRPAQRPKVVSRYSRAVGKRAEEEKDEKFSRKVAEGAAEAQEEFVDDVDDVDEADEEE